MRTDNYQEALEIAHYSFWPMVYYKLIKFSGLDPSKLSGTQIKYYTDCTDKLVEYLIKTEDVYWSSQARILDYNELINYCICKYCTEDFSDPYNYKDYLFELFLRETINSIVTQQAILDINYEFSMGDGHNYD